MNKICYLQKTFKDILGSFQPQIVHLEYLYLNYLQ